MTGTCGSVLLWSPSAASPKPSPPPQSESQWSSGALLCLGLAPRSWLALCRFLSSAWRLRAARASMLSVIFFRSLISHCCLSSFSAAYPPRAQASAQALFRRIKDKKQTPDPRSQRGGGEGVLNCHRLTVNPKHILSDQTCSFSPKSN